MIRALDDGISSQQSLGFCEQLKTNLKSIKSRTGGGLLMLGQSFH
jgi:hypothetical protein